MLLLVLKPGVILSPRRLFAIRHLAFLFSRLGDGCATGIWWVKARDIARHPKMCRIFSHTTKNYQIVHYPNPALA